MNKKINKITKKLIIILCLISSFSFLVPTYSNASLNETLINPVKDLILLIADGAMGIMQGFTMRDYTVTEEKTDVGTKAFSRTVNDLTGGAFADEIDRLNEMADIDYTPYKIFTNKIPTFDVNFFSSKNNSKQVLTTVSGSISEETTQKAKTALDNISKGNYTNIDDFTSDIMNLRDFVREGFSTQELNRMDYSVQLAYEYKIVSETGSATDKKKYCETYGFSEFPTLSTVIERFRPGDEDSAKSEIASNSEISPSTFSYLIQDALTHDSKVILSTAYTLAPTISKWYSTLSIIAIVSMMSVLVYSGIRIIISSASKDKAKYKQMIVDWFVAVCLLFFMRYIMSFSFAFVDKIISLLSNINSGTNEFFNYSRNYAGLQTNGWLALGYTIIYVVLVCITIYFTFVYLKRVLYLAFLTLISPLVAFTYPIDKINDGKAQAFNMWLKEYLFNLLIQPLHLVLYSVLIGTAADLVDSNYIYAVVALGFMTQAEKLLRKFFGFEKAQTPGFLNGPAGGALMMEGFKKLTGWGPGSHNKSKGSSDSSSSESNKDKVTIPQRSVDSYGLMSDKSSEETSTNTSNEVSVPLSLNDADSVDTNVPWGFDALDNSYNSNSGNQTFNIPLSEDSSANDSDIYNVPLSFNDPNLVDNDVPWGFDALDNSNNQTFDIPLSNNSDNANSEILESNEDSNSSSTDSTPNKFTRFARAFDATTSAYGRGLKRKLKNYASNEILNPSKNLASVGKVFKSAAKIAAGIGTGAVGLGIGIATGDPKQALQDTIIGAQAGSRLTGNIADKIGNTLHVDGLDTTFERAYYGDDYNEHLEKEKYQKWIDQNEEQLIRTLGKDKFEKLRKNETLEKYKEDGMTDKQIKDNLGEEKYKELKERELLKEYFSAGIDNVEEIIACEKFKDAHTNFDTDSAIGVMKIANDMHDKDLPKKKEILFENFKDKNPEKSKDDIDKLVANQLSFNKEIEKYKKNAI